MHNYVLFLTLIFQYGVFEQLKKINASMHLYFNFLAWIFQTFEKKKQQENFKC